MVQELASYRRCVDRIDSNWPRFLEKRRERLKQQDRHGVAAEKVAENILEDLFTAVLDWSLGDINYQVGYVDLLLTYLGVKYLVMEVKRPGSLAWNRRAVEAALDQALRYANAQKVKRIGVSDGVMLYAADIEHGGLQDRVFVSLQDTVPPGSLWWLSVHGIYRPRKHSEDAALRLLPELSQVEVSVTMLAGEALLHPKYQIPACCFAYVGSAGDPSTWKLPYRLANGSVDTKRLPKAIQCILSNYRGARVSGIPEEDIPDVLVRLGCAVASLGKMPHQSGETSQVYQQLAQVLEQLERLDDVTTSR
jgi:phage gp36-like protein